LTGLPMPVTLRVVLAGARLQTRQRRAIGSRTHCRHVGHFQRER
jgi:hypothetical protein